MLKKKEKLQQEGKRKSTNRIVGKAGFFQRNPCGRTREKNRRIKIKLKKDAEKEGEVAAGRKKKIDK